jgi:chromosomal replication initiator protein
MICNPRIWGDALSRLQTEIPDFAFVTWIRPLATKLDGNRVVLGCPSSFHRDRVRIQFQEPLERNLRAAAEAHATPGATSSTSDTHPIPEQTRNGNEGQAESGKPLTIELVAMSEFAAMSGHVIEVTELEEREQLNVQAGAERAMRSVAAGSPAQQVRAANGAASSPSHSPAHPRTQAAGHGMSEASDASKVSRQRPLESAPIRHLAPASDRRPASKRIATPNPSEAGEPKSHSTQPKKAAAETPQPELPFSFESFVVGPCNALAREAALALARTRQRSLNLLYLGGDSGMGKTHLARATAAEARRHSGHSPDSRHGAPTGPRSQRHDAYAQGGRAAEGARAPRHNEAPSIVYTSAEQFTNDFVSAMRNGHSEDFKRRYRGRIGLLVVEDIQFFSGRVKTQLELFHTVQHVLDAGGRVLMTGDRTPRELTGLDARVRDQVGRGFVAELEPPDAIVRRHILRSKAAAGGVHLPVDCLDRLVEASRGSVRDIESMLIQVVTTASLLGRTIDLDLTREAIALKSSASTALTPSTVAVSEIVRIVAAFFGRRPEALASRSRRRDVLVPRQLAMFLAHRYTDASFAEIGRGLGRGHPAVRNAIERIERQILENAPIRYQVEALSERIDSTLKQSREDRTN